MLETYYRMLNPTETIQRAMPAITEAFVTFYGEENREFIEQKFRDILIIGYSSPATVKRILNDMKKIKKYLFPMVGKKIYLKDFGIIIPHMKNAGF